MSGKLRVALVVKNKPGPKRRVDRNMGYWSYDVPEFEWDHFCFGENFVCHTGDYKALGYDLIVHEDGGNWGVYQDRAIPVVYMVIDSTLSDTHYKKRLKQAEQADLILVDHDRIERFTPANKSVRRWNYCVNDRVFYDRGVRKTVDVSFHCSAGDQPGGTERRAVRQALHKWAEHYNKTYTSGVRGLDEYALAFSQSRICVNLPRTTVNRPHRVFDVMAAGSLLLTGPIPIVDGDDVFDGKHFLKFDSQENLEDKLLNLLDNHERREQITQAGHDLVMEKHTWSVRSKQLLSVLEVEHLV